MKQYKRGNGNTGSGIEPIPQPFIAITIEELKEIWEMATKNGQMIEQVKFKRPYTPSPNFEQYLTSKGVNIP